MDIFWVPMIPLLSPHCKKTNYFSSSPIGIAIGTMVFAFSTESATMDLAVGLLESISTGTFLFVVFVELMPKELDLRSQNAFRKMVLIILGFVLMGGMQALGALEDAH